jgi:hypothetical protein
MTRTQFLAHAAFLRTTSAKIKAKPCTISSTDFGSLIEYLSLITRYTEVGLMPDAESHFVALLDSVADQLESWARSS